VDSKTDEVEALKRHIDRLVGERDAALRRVGEEKERGDSHLAAYIAIRDSSGLERGAVLRDIVPECKAEPLVRVAENVLVRPSAVVMLLEQRGTHGNMVTMEVDGVAASLHLSSPGIDHMARLLGLTVAPPVESGDTGPFWEAVDDVDEFVETWASGCRDGERARASMAVLRAEHWRVTVRKKGA
jgi:hypothetical protein